MKDNCFLLKNWLFLKMSRKHTSLTLFISWGGVRFEVLAVNYRELCLLPKYCRKWCRPDGSMVNIMWIVNNTHTCLTVCIYNHVKTHNNSPGILIFVHLILLEQHALHRLKWTELRRLRSWGTLFNTTSTSEELQTTRYAKVVVLPEYTNAD